MPTKAPLNISIICESEELFQWLNLTIRLGNLKTKRVHYSYPVDASTIFTKPCPPNLIIITEAEFKLFIKKSKAQLIAQLPCPVLVLTESFNAIRKPQNLDVTFDTLPIQIVTINLLEHAISSLLKDFALTTKLTTLAHFDPLTGAANRLLFEDRLSESIKRVKRFKEPISLIYFDLDEFKPVNDTFGHDIGDELLKCFVNIVKSQIREIDTIARLGGDEFALILTNSDKASAENIAEKIIVALKCASEKNSNKIEIKSSLGAVTADSCTSEKLTPSLLLKKADEAVYKAKKVKGTSLVFDNTLNVCSTQK